MPEVEPREMVPVYQNIRHCLAKPLLRKEEEEQEVMVSTSFFLGTIEFVLKKV